jgi:hypothetical protein
MRGIQGAQDEKFSVPALVISLCALMYRSPKGFRHSSRTDFRGSLDEPQPAQAGFVKPAGTTPADENHN